MRKFNLSIACVPFHLLCTVCRHWRSKLVHTDKQRKRQANRRENKQTVRQAIENIHTLSVKLNSRVEEEKLCLMLARFSLSISFPLYGFPSFPITANAAVAAAVVGNDTLCSLRSKVQKKLVDKMLKLLCLSASKVMVMTLMFRLP